MSIEAREFLAKVLPWPQLSDAVPSYVNIHYTVQGAGYAKPAWRGSPCQSVQEAVKVVENILKKPETRDIYVCMSSQSAFAERAGAKGKFKTAIRSKDNAVALKALFLDLDAKGEDKNSYATLDDAADALNKFLVVMDLPRPSLIVATGGGLHVYWTLSVALAPEVWLPLARSLAEATKFHGLKCDTQCTVDSARVLRVPDTYNRKQDVPRRVRLAGPRTDFDYSVERIERCLEPYKVAAPAHSPASSFDPALFPRRAALTGPNELSAGLEVAKSPPVSLRAVCHECPWLRDTVLTGGANNANPLWNITNLIATFTEGDGRDEGRSDAHRMGSSHNGYSRESTDEQFDRKVRERESLGLGWPSCKTISATGSSFCQSCKHFPEQRSPLNFASRTSPASSAPTKSAPGSTPGSPGSPGSPGAPSSPAGSSSSTPSLATAPSTTDLPSGYVRGIDGVISIMTLMEDGSSKPIPICEYGMSVPWIEAGSEPMLHFDSVVERGKVIQITLPLEHVGSQEMRKLLQVQGLMLPIGAKGVENVSRFLVAWIKQLQETRDAVASSPFGWSVDRGKVAGFVYGGRLFAPSGDTASASADSVTGRHYRPTGELAPWTAAAELITAQGRPDIEVLLASAFAGPLIRFTGQPGVLLAAYSSESGIGKTTALKVAQAVWGDPIRAIQSLSDTQNSIMNKLGEIKSLPLYWDELKTEEDTKKFVNVTFQVTQGKEKSRLKSNASQREPGSWQTLLVSASNDSLLDYVTQQTNTTTAGLYRIFQYAVKPAPKGGPGLIEPSEAAVLVSKVNDNYGQVGLAYARYLGTNHVQIEADVRQMMTDIGKEVSTNQEERFWIALLACIELGARYANALGFTKFNLPAIRAFMIQTLGEMRGHRAAQPIDMTDVSNVVGILAQFTNAMRSRHMLFTNKIPVTQGKPAKGAYIVDVRKTNVQKLDGIYIHCGVEDKLMRISSTQLNEWLDEKNYSRHIFTTAMEKELGAQRINARLGAGTADFVNMAERVWHFDIAGTPLMNFLDEA